LNNFPFPLLRFFFFYIAIVSLDRCFEFFRTSAMIFSLFNVFLFFSGVAPQDFGRVGRSLAFFFLVYPESRCDFPFDEEFPGFFPPLIAFFSFEHPHSL